tara:strand:- start:634 stop:834 length:201 start_codon:yes stop_codon:yes gene_type:complete
LTLEGTKGQYKLLNIQTPTKNMRNHLFWTIVVVMILGLYFNTEATKEFLSGFFLRLSDILVALAGK